METFWDRMQDLRESVNGTAPQQREEVTLKTRLIKFTLGLYLFQSLFIAIVLSIKYNSSAAWLVPISAFLQIGWFWNKVTDSWRGQEETSYRPFESVDLSQEPSQSLHPPTIVISPTDPIAGHQDEGPRDKEIV